MSLQQELTNTFGAIAAAGTAVPYNFQQKKLRAEQAEEKKAAKSYGNEIEALIGKAMESNPAILKNQKYFNQALELRDKYLNLMREQRKATREYRNQYAKGSKEYNRIEAEGQARKQANLAEFEYGLSRIGQPGRPKKY